MLPSKCVTNLVFEEGLNVGINFECLTSEGVHDSVFDGQQSEEEEEILILLGLLYLILLRFLVMFLLDGEGQSAF
jgi:hypothetical protein